MVLHPHAKWASHLQAAHCFLVISPYIETTTWSAILEAVFFGRGEPQSVLARVLHIFCLIKKKKLYAWFVLPPVFMLEVQQTNELHGTIWIIILNIIFSVRQWPLVVTGPWKFLKWTLHYAPKATSYVNRKTSSNFENLRFLTCTDILLHVVLTIYPCNIAATSGSNKLVNFCLWGRCCTAATRVAKVLQVVLWETICLHLKATTLFLLNICQNIFLYLLQHFRFYLLEERLWWKYHKQNTFTAYFS